MMLSLWFEGKDKTKIFSSQVLHTNNFSVCLHEPKQATMPQTTQLNQYTKEEIRALAGLAWEVDLLDLAAKLNADYHWLADMEKEKAE